LEDILKLSKMVLKMKQSLLQSTPLDDILNLSKMVLISKSRYWKARHWIIPWTCSKWASVSHRCYAKLRRWTCSEPPRNHSHYDENFVLYHSILSNKFKLNQYIPMTQFTLHQFWNFGDVTSRRTNTTIMR
jgi:hypothetical protein